MYNESVVMSVIFVGDEHTNRSGGSRHAGSMCFFGASIRTQKRKRERENHHSRYDFCVFVLFDPIQPPFFVWPRSHHTRFLTGPYDTQKRRNGSSTRLADLDYSAEPGPAAACEKPHACRAIGRSIRDRGRFTVRMKSHWSIDPYHIASAASIDVSMHRRIRPYNRRPITDTDTRYDAQGHTVASSIAKRQLQERSGAAIF